MAARRSPSGRVDGLRHGERGGRAAGGAAAVWSMSTSRRTSSVRSPTIPPTSRSPSPSAACWPTTVCSAWPGPRSSAAGARRRGSRPRCARRCGRTTSPAARSTWASTGSGPTIMRHGTPEQQRQHLPPIARGEVIWCQGFSEPDAGSDLASLQTAARRDGDGWRVSGQKIWTSYATMAQWCFLLARTSRGEKKQQGLTIFLVPMSDPAIEVRPIALHARPAPPQRGLLRRRCGSTEADVLGDGRRGLAGRAGGARLRARRHRPLRPLRAAAAVGAGRARRRVGRPARRAARPVGADAHPLPAGPAARLPGGRRCRRSRPGRRPATPRPTASR